ncbi:hypothetical protein, partial [Enterococcus faecium]
SAAAAGFSVGGGLLSVAAGTLSGVTGLSDTAGGVVATMATAGAAADAVLAEVGGVTGAAAEGGGPGTGAAGCFAIVPVTESR